MLSEAIDFAILFLPLRKIYDKLTFLKMSQFSSQTSMSGAKSQFSVVRPTGQKMANERSPV
jgi:hypothetical protein